MRQHTAVIAAFLLGGVFALGLLALASVLGPGVSQADDATMHNCPQPGRWAIAVWGGDDGADPGEAFATCGEGAVIAAYGLDPQTGGWLGWFAAQPGMATLSKLDKSQGVIALAGAEVPTPPTAVPSPSPTRTPTPTPTPTPTQPPAGGVQVLNYRSHQGEFGSLYFYGEVESRESAEVAGVEAVLTLSDGANKVVGTGDAYVEPTCLSPSEKGAFSIYVLDPPDTWAKETIQVQWRPKSSWDNCYKSFSVSGVSIAPGKYGGLTVRGAVKNTGGESADFIQVTFIGYDASDKVLVVDNSFADIDTLAPGESSPFEIWVMELDTAPPSYRIVAEGLAS